MAVTEEARVLALVDAIYRAALDDDLGRRLADTIAAGFESPSCLVYFARRDAANPSAMPETSAILSDTPDFPDGLSSVSFARAGLHSATHPEWSATAFGDGGAVLGSVSEGRLSGDHAAKTFTLSGGIIRSVRFDANAQGTAGFATPLLDDLVLTPVPEPSTYALMAVGVVALASGVRVRRRRDGSEVRG